MSIFKKAERAGVKLRISLIGPSGSGKTYSALTLATGIGGKIALADTERDRSLHYAKLFNFDHVAFLPPYNPERFVSVISEAEKEGYTTIIIDSASHEWNGEGGCLDLVDKLTQASSSKNSFNAWGKVTPRHNEFINKINSSSINIVLCIRGKDEYVIEESNGKKSPRKIGVGAIQRDGIEFEMTVSLLIDQKSHISEATKDTTGIFNDPHIITVKDGENIKKWSEGL